MAPDLFFEILEIIIDFANDVRDPVRTHTSNQGILRHYPAWHTTDIGGFTDDDTCSISRTLIALSQVSHAFRTMALHHIFQDIVVTLPGCNFSAGKDPFIKGFEFGQCPYPAFVKYG